MSTSHPSALVGPAHTPRAIEKAARLIAAGRVRAVPDARVYLVAGDSGEYRVVSDPDGVHCPCEARTPLCSHVLAVLQIRAGEQAHEQSLDPFHRVLAAQDLADRRARGAA